MLSSKLQNDLMNAYQQVYEGKRGHAAGDSDVEKQASQLASDVRYKAKGKVKDGASEEEKKKIFMQILGASPAPTAVKSMAKTKLLGEDVVLEDKKMAKQSDDALAAAHKKFSSMDQSTPSNRFMLKRIEKEQKKRKKVTEAKVDMKLPDYKRATARDKRYGNPYGSLELGGGIRKDRRADHEARRGVKKEEVVNEMGGMKIKQVVPKKPVTQNPKDMSKKVGEKAPVDYRMLSQSYEPVGNIFKEFKMTPKKNKKPGKSMDPVGQEDGDINNDGKKDGTDKYLANRRKAIGKAIAKKRGKVKEGFSAWRIDLDFNEQVKK